MSYGNQGQYEGAPKRKGPGGFMFLAMVLIGGFFLMNFLQQQDSSVPADNRPGQSTERRDFENPNDYERNQQRPVERTDPKGGIYGAGQAERPVTHPDAGDWDMQEVTADKNTNAAKRNDESKRTDKGDWSMEEVPSGGKKDQTFNLSNANDATKPNSKSTKAGDWELEEVDKR